MTRTTTAMHRQLHERPDPLRPQAVDLRHTSPGVGARVAETWVSEIGTAMTCVPTAGHLAAWAGRCPGHHQSAGPQRSGHTRQGTVYVRGTLTQAAWAATRTTPTSLAAPSRRLTPRVGQRRALVAVGHRILVMAWPVRSTHASDEAWGRDDVDRSDAKASRLQRIRTLEALRLNGVVEPAPSVSAASSCS